MYLYYLTLALAGNKAGEFIPHLPTGFIVKRAELYSKTQDEQVRAEWFMGKKEVIQNKAFLRSFLIFGELLFNEEARKNYLGAPATRPAFTRAEVEQIRQAIGTVPYADYVYCMIYLGYRPGEMLALKKDSYDAEHNCLIGGGKTEAGRNRIVTISPKIAPFISHQLQTKGQWLFPRLSDDGRISENYFRKFCFQPVMRALGITGRVPYSCRHTFANLLKDITGSDTDKSSLMGHANASIIMVPRNQTTPSKNSVNMVE